MQIKENNGTIPAEHDHYHPAVPTKLNPPAVKSVERPFPAKKATPGIAAPDQIKKDDDPKDKINKH